MDHPEQKPATSSPTRRGKDRNLTLIAWVVTILISTVPDIVCDQLLGSVPSLLITAKLGLLLGLSLAALVWHPLRPLRNFFLVMFAFFGLGQLRPLANFSLPFLQKLFGGTAFDLRMQAEQTSKLAVSLAMIAVLLVLGYRNRDFFLARGNMQAPIQPVKLLGFPRADPWPRFGLQWGFYIAAVLAVAQYFAVRPGSGDWLKLLPMLPSVLFYAALNAFNEEITYRSSMLATLEPVSGSRSALWMAAFFFGIAHYFGTPGGLLGGVLSIFMGWILGKAMIETRGFFWAWWIHFLSDVAIFLFIALTLVK